jgi:hypothetical protein
MRCFTFDAGQFAQREFFAMCFGRLVAVAFGLLVLASDGLQSKADQWSLPSLRDGFESQIKPLLRTYCNECHNGDDAQAEIDFSTDNSIEDVRRRTTIWIRVREMLESGQMPPKESKALSESGRKAFITWVVGYLQWEASSRAGDPGPIVLRRLNNSELKYTVQDFTMVSELDPTREFPGDNAAGEGFTNTGIAMTMSPAMVTKYMDAAKEVAEHMVLLPEAIRFSASVNRRDWSEECLAHLRNFYQRFTDRSGATRVNLQGIQFETNQGGRLPLLKYLKASILARHQSVPNPDIENFAKGHQLSPKYLKHLIESLSREGSGESPALDQIRQQWRTASADQDAEALESLIAQWQWSLWKFNVIGHVVQDVLPTTKSSKWQEPTDPFMTQVELRQKLTSSGANSDATLYLSATDAGDGDEQDWIVWENPRLVSPGLPDLPLKGVRDALMSLDTKRRRIQSQTQRCLDALMEQQSLQDAEVIASIAKDSQVDEPLLRAWMSCLGMGSEAATIENYLTQKLARVESYEFVQGWVGSDALSVLANFSDQHVRIPGNMKPHSVAVHPSPSQSICIGWRSPIDDEFQIQGAIQHAHPECGNGVQWSLELRRGNTRQQLAAGFSRGPSVVSFPPIERLAIRKDELLVLSIGPRDGNHACDLTAVDLNVRSATMQWDLAVDNSSDILVSNPHSDRYGNTRVWNFFREPTSAIADSVLVPGSLLDRWMRAESKEQKRELASDLQRYLAENSEASVPETPDGKMRRLLLSMTGPLVSALGNMVDKSDSSQASYGIDPTLFGTHPNGLPVDEHSICMKAPCALHVKLPKELVDGFELVVTGKLHTSTSGEASVQFRIANSPTKSARLDPSQPIVLASSGAARKRWEKSVDELRSLFPAALCYEKIVPVDEVVTLTLFYREDEHLQRLMLNDSERAELDRLWDELLYISQEPLLLAAAFEQLAEFATQDRPDKVNEFAPLRQPIAARAEAFRNRLAETEVFHLNSLLASASRAYRRDLTNAEEQELRSLYLGLRKQELSHEESLRLTLARILVAPSFLYKVERPAPAKTPKQVSGFELATRLSYFLWSSMPDEELMASARSGKLLEDRELAHQVERMLNDPKSKRLALEFGCQWLHVRDFEENDQKSESVFPTFAGLRSAMLQETILYFDDLIRNNRPALDVVHSDYTFLNEALAKHYGIPDVMGSEWRRVDGVSQYGRGGVLGLASTLASQSGASRTSPILRGNWISEVLLGDKLPKPPKDVPSLPDELPAGLSERQLIERHSSDPACAKCHQRLDPLGFALEQFDAIGRYREIDATGRAIHATSRLMDGTEIDGMRGLRTYLVQSRKKDFIRQLQRKLLGYALGRAVQLSDEPLLESLSADADQGNGIQDWIQSMVRSRQFREIRGIQFSDE